MRGIRASHSARGGPPTAALLTHSAQLSGAELALTRLAGAYTDYRVVVVLAEPGPLVEKLDALGVAVSVVPIRAHASRVSRTGTLHGYILGALSIIGHGWALGRYLRDIDASVVHSNTLKSHVYGFIATLRLPRSVLIWHVRDRLTSDYLGRFPGAVMRFMCSFLPDAVVANSKTTIDAAQFGGRAPHGIVAPSPLGDEFVPGDGDVGEFVSTIGMVGRISPWKGQDLFLEACRQLGRSSLTYRVIGSPLFGEVDYHRDIREFARKNFPQGQVEFVEHTSDVARQYRELDLVVHSSRLPEPFGNVVVEAQACGTPVIASGEGGPAEVITPYVNGLLFTPNDVRSLVDKIEESLDRGLRRELVCGGLRNAERYRPAEVAEDVQELYRECRTKAPLQRFGVSIRRATRSLLRVMTRGRPAETRSRR